VDVLFVCTGNQCRSPMAEKLLAAAVGGRAGDLTVSSAGFVSEGTPSPPEAVAALSALGIDLSSHRSRTATPDLLRSSSLVVAMTRQHLIDLAVESPSEWNRFFTFADVLRRGGEVGGRARGETVRAWALRLHADRGRQSLLSLSVADDVADPMGGGRRDFEATRNRLAGMASGLADLLSPA
jgi:protein-tyrosine phosphatase